MPTTTGLPGALPTTAGAGAAGIATKTVTLRFINPHPGQANVESGFLEDIHITADIRTNSVILSAPSKSMELLVALIKELDVVPANRAEVNIFHLKKSDATTISNMLQQLFLGTGGLGTGARPTTAAPTPFGAPGLPTGPTTTGPLGTTAAGAGGLPRQVFTGRVSAIAREAEYTPRNVQTREERVNLMFALKIDVDNRGGALLIGMPVDVRFF